MKRVSAILLVLALLLCSGFAFAEGGILMCINCTVNGMTTMRFAAPTIYTAIAQEGMTVSAWKINGAVLEGQSGEFLVFTADGDTVVEAVPAGETPVYEPEEVITVTSAPTLNAGPVRITAVGAHLQYIDESGNPGGESVTELDFTDAYVNPLTGKTCLPGVAEFRVTADKPHQSDIDYWVIGGVRYDFCNTVRYITVTNLTEDMTFEVVYKKESAKTLSGERASEGNCTVRSENAKMAFVKGSTASGGYFTEFDFTSGYTNKATGESEKGGQISVKVIANNSSRVKVWQFGNASFRMSTDSITHFIARGLNRSMTYKAD